MHLQYLSSRSRYSVVPIPTYHSWYPCYSSQAILRKHSATVPYRVPSCECSLGARLAVERAPSDEYSQSTFGPVDPASAVPHSLVPPQFFVTSLIHGYCFTPRYVVTLSLSLSSSFNRAYAFGPPPVVLQTTSLYCCRSTVPSL
jgi:hypothetical protein